MFKNNLEALEIKNKALADRIAKIKPDSLKDISAARAENGEYILIYKQVPLHDTKDPMREAKSIWFRNIKQELKNNDIQVVFGLGLGYLFKRAYVSAKSKVFLFEPSLEIIRFVLEYVDFSKEILDDRVFIFNEPDDLLKQLKSDFLVGDNIEFIYLPSYAVLFKDTLVKLSTEIFDVIKNKTVDMNTLSVHKTSTAVKNILHHMNNFGKIRAVDSLKGSFEGKTALIAAAGPSLKDDIAEIKASRDKFVLFSVSSALAYLIENGITPDFVVASDINAVTSRYKDVDSKQLEDISLIFEGRAQGYLSDSPFRYKICYFSNTDKIADALVNNFSGNIKTHESSLSVSILAFYAARVLGFSNIIYSGLDLAMTDNTAYAKSAFSETVSKDKLISDYNGIKVEKNLIPVLSADGKEILTREDYLLFIKQFEEILSNGEKIVSTAKKGALIRGMTYETIEEALGSLHEKIPFVDEVLNKSFVSSKKEWEAFSNKAYEYLDSQKEILDLLYQKTVYLHEKTKELKDFAEDDNFDLNFLQEKYDEEKDDLSYLRTNIMNNVFLASYMQVDLLNYVQGYQKEHLQNIDIFRKNISLELELCAKIMDKYEDLKSSMECVLNNHYEKNS